MKKRIAFLMLLVLLLLAALLFPVTKKTRIDIKANYDNTLSVILRPNDWKKWYPGIRNGYALNTAVYRIAPDTTGGASVISTAAGNFTIHRFNLSAYQVSETTGKGARIFAFEILADTLVHHTEVEVVQKSPLFSLLFKQDQAGEQAMQGLKAFLEDPKAFYGYRIEKAKIRDSIIASYRCKISKKELFDQIRVAHGRLQDYVSQNGLQVSGHLTMSLMDLAGDSTQLTLGLPVNHNAPPAKGVRCLQLPGAGNVVVGFYTGRFADRHQIYQAIGKYINDHSLSSPMEPFERYLNDAMPASDSDAVDIELNYPVY